MNRERAETYLRVLAEAELRRATSQPRGNAQRAGYAARLNRVAQALAFTGALDEGAADQIQWPLARHPHQRSERHERRNRATPGNSATAKPRHDLNRGSGNRAIS